MLFRDRQGVHRSGLSDFALGPGACGASGAGSGPLIGVCEASVVGGGGQDLLQRKPVIGDGPGEDRRNPGVRPRQWG